MSDNITSMRKILHRVDESGKKAGLKLNAKKTKVMQLKPENSSLYDVKIDQTVLENVEDFKYLGSVKTIDGSCSKDIKMRIGMAKKKMIKLINVWKDHNIPIELKLKLLKCLIWPVMMYGCEAWSQKKDDDKRIEAAEMWFYRRILRVKWTDKRTNESVLKELKTERTLLNLINARKLKYVGHALRNHRTSLMKTVCEGRLDGRRRKGRPPISLVTNLTTACGLSLHQIVQKSQDRAGWQQKVRLSIATADTASGDADRNTKIRKSEKSGETKKSEFRLKSENLHPWQTLHATQATTTTVSSVSAVAFKAPQFWQTNAKARFIRLEASFNTRTPPITKDLTKFHHVIQLLDSSTARRVQAVLENPPPVGKYDSLKSALLNAYEATQLQKDQ
ncbi:endonuclease-reverse transcriptase [Elysia marginata]|uniref:Endonuclease-reverse transcriptase n=1 Tax=Elysia marginata TaxID=1093978 RepID=A0AAV4I8A5_9GAST|nr:endonuclease-reverse transcriptase [Elysia marginata]